MIEECRMADFVTTHRLTHKASLKMIEAGVAKAEALGCKCRWPWPTRAAG